MNVRAHTTCLSARGRIAAPAQGGGKGTDPGGEPRVSLTVLHSFVADTRFSADLTPALFIPRIVYARRRRRSVFPPRTASRSSAVKPAASSAAPTLARVGIGVIGQSLPTMT